MDDADEDEDKDESCCSQWCDILANAANAKDEHDDGSGGSGGRWRIKVLLRSKWVTLSTTTTTKPTPAKQCDIIDNEQL